MRLTVNQEDGGSNPLMPANLYRKEKIMSEKQINHVKIFTYYAGVVASHKMTDEINDYIESVIPQYKCINVDTKLHDGFIIFTLSFTLKY